MKKKLALLLSLTMTIASAVSFNAFADPDGEDEDPTDSPTGISAALNDMDENTLNGGATLNAVEASVYRVIIPTTLKLDYIVDPQGLATMSGNEAKLDDLEDAAGSIYRNGEISFANRSSKDIIVTATVAATDATATDKASIGDFADLEDATDPTVALAVAVGEATFAADADGENEDSGTGAGSNPATFKATTNWGSSLTAYEISKTDKSVDIPITLKKAEYVAKKTAGASDGDPDTYSYELKDTNTVGGGVTLALTGRCSTKGDWAKDGLGLPTTNVTYAFSDIAAGATELSATNYSIGGSLTAVDTEEYDLKLDAAASTATMEDAVIANDGTVTFTYTPAAGSDATLNSTTVKVIYSGNESDIMTWSENKRAVFASNKLSVTIPKITVDALTADSTGKKFIFEDTDGNTFTVYATAE